LKGCGVAHCGPRHAPPTPLPEWEYWTDTEQRQEPPPESTPTSPLIVTNADGQRLCEKHVGQRYWRWKVSANSTNIASRALRRLGRSNERGSCFRTPIVHSLVHTSTPLRVAVLAESGVLQQEGRRRDRGSSDCCHPLAQSRRGRDGMEQEEVPQRHHPPSTGNPFQLARRQRLSCGPTCLAYLSIPACRASLNCQIGPGALFGGWHEVADAFLFTTPR
jgi:hypothetical protein